ncbi:nickel pincer cofactor biosynthesis protein LarC [bacterium]|nr:nickel pincer cofactor biosynthesis protein LarC [bacterium]MBU1782917.1 nickel pincer cofactor biosynthesis protein LarC [bacterium]
MKIAYFDCFSGLSGDMIIGALIDAGLKLDYLNEKLSSLKGVDFKLQVKEVAKHHLSGCKFEVIYDRERKIKTLAEVTKIIEGSTLEKEIKEESLRIYQNLFKAEAKLHRKDPDQVHLHELSSIDTIVDIVGAVVGLSFFQVEQVISSPLNLGYGRTNFGEGELPVPAPATCELLKNIPVYSQEAGELVTPTGAAIISTLAYEYSHLPKMKIEAIGYGAGEKELPNLPNFLRIFIGEKSFSFQEEEVMVLETNIDDSLPLIYENLTERLFEEGALDVYLTPIQMKKFRPGIILSVIAPKEKIQVLASLIFRETSTTGIRLNKVSRLKLPRQLKEFKTPYGKVKAKLINFEGRDKVSVEYEDCKKIAQAHGLSFQEVYQDCLKEIEEQLKQLKSKESRC